MTNEDENTPAEGEETPPEEDVTSEEAAAAESGAADGDDVEDAEAASEAMELKELATGGQGGDSDVEPHHIASELEPVFDVPVNVQAILGKSNIEVSQLLKLGAGSVVELDRKVGEAIDIYVNNRLVARGEVVLVEEKLGVTMTEIIKSERN